MEQDTVSFVRRDELRKFRTFSYWLLLFIFTCCLGYNMIGSTGLNYLLRNSGQRNLLPHRQDNSSHTATMIGTLTTGRNNWMRGAIVLVFIDFFSFSCRISCSMLSPRCQISRRENCFWLLCCTINSRYILFGRCLCTIVQPWLIVRYRVQYTLCKIPVINLTTDNYM